MSVSTTKGDILIFQILQFFAMQIGQIVSPPSGIALGSQIVLPNDTNIHVLMQDL